MELIRCSTSKKIKLRDGGEVVIGRGQVGGRRLNVSRCQVSLVADSKSDTTHVSNTGLNPIRVDRSVLGSGERSRVRGDFELQLPGFLRYRVVCTSGVGRRHMEPKDFTVLNNLLGEIESRGDLERGWNELDNAKLMIFQSYSEGGGSRSDKVAAFDMDGTLIRTRSGKTFPVDENDWIFYSDKVPDRIKRLHETGFGIVVFSNQGGIAFGSTNKNKLKTKIERVVRALDVPLQVYLATGYDFYRKPCPGMWFAFLAVNRCRVDRDACIYVGDAAGRPNNWCAGKKKDFSMADRLFARNARLKFVTPEEFFHNEPPAPFVEPGFDPNKVTFKQHSEYDVPYHRLEMIIMVGSPGSGKSHFVENHLLTKGYVSVSRDVLNSWQNCIKAADKYLGSDRNVVIDNTNVNVATRERYVQLAQERGVALRCFVMESDADLCKHNNKYRQLTDRNHTLVTDVIINDYWKKFEPPTLDQGFLQIVHIPFVPNFVDENHRQLYFMYLQ